MTTFNLTAGDPVGLASLGLMEPYLQPELVLPIQAIDDNRPAKGERKLLLELVAGALYDLSSLEGTYSEDAEAWIIQGDLGYITCRDACDYLGIDYEAMVIKVTEGLRLIRRRRGNGYIRSYPNRRSIRADGRAHSEKHYERR